MATPTPTPAFAPVERPLEDDESDTGRLECVSAETGGATRLEDSVVEVVWLVVVVEVVEIEWPVVVVVIVICAVEVVVGAVVVAVGEPVCTGRESLFCHRIETPSA
jgi:hypothetical protein